MTGKITIHDDKGDKRLDRLESRLKAVEVLEENYDFCKVGTEKVQSIEENLTKRRKNLWEGKEEWKEESPIEELDRASIFIIDNAVIETDASRLAYLARCFSECGLIIGFNVYGDYGDLNFDLNLGRETRDIDSELNYDIMVDDKSFENNGFWKGERDRDFRPWYWPAAIKYQKEFEKKVEDVEENLGEPLLPYLGFSEEIVNVMPDETLEFVTGRGGEKTEKEPLEYTFRDYLEYSETGLKHNDRGKIQSLNEEQIARIVSSRISTWLERIVLPPQNILIDAPHLVYKLPSLLEGSTSELESWNKTAKITEEVEELEINDEKIQEYRFENEKWVSRPVWFWKKVRNDHNILEIEKPFERETPDYVFCEDTSRFIEREESESFEVTFPSSMEPRYVERLSEINYFPITRLAS